MSKLKHYDIDNIAKRLFEFVAIAITPIPAYDNPACSFTHAYILS